MKLLITSIFLFSSALSFAKPNSNPESIFPTPDNFTTNKNEARKHRLFIHVSASTLKKLKTSGVNNMPFIGDSLCQNLRITYKATTTINKTHYTLVPYASESDFNIKTGQYSALCVWGWIKSKNLGYAWGSKYIEDSLKYYKVWR